MNQLAERVFEPVDLIAFAEASGDWNPIHVDPVAARRLLGGAQVTHGILVLLWALETYFATLGDETGSAPSRIRVTFHRPVLVGQPVALFCETDGLESGQIRLTVRGKEALATVLLNPGGTRIPGNVGVVPGQRSLPCDQKFSDLKGQSGELALQVHGHHPSILTTTFPQLIKLIGEQPVAALMALSRLVGMACPGLHSLFAGLDVTLQGASVGAVLRWQVVRHTIQQAPLRIQVSGGGISGSLDAFVRPAPVMQATMGDVGALVAPHSCLGQIALIVGGSRGLGELTAKIVAAAGGEAIITYKQGQEDALRVAAEIQAGGGRCRVLEMDVMNPDHALAQLSAGELPTHCYYFASSRIEPQQGLLFDQKLYASFSRIYVEAFGHLISELTRILPDGWCAFYPSTVFIDEAPREFGEYIIAKAAGEALCAHLNQIQRGGAIVSRRLPRMLTDQTAGVIRRNMVDALPVLISVVNELHHHLNHRKDVAS